MKAAIGLLALSGTFLFTQILLAQENMPAETVSPTETTVAEGNASESLSLSAPDLDDSERSAKNSIWLEGLGSALLYSVNYERMIIDDLGIRAGFSFLSLGASVGSGDEEVSAKAKIVLFPITANYVGVSSSNKKHCLELGGGATIMFASGAASGGGISAEGSGAGGFGTAHVGYRIQPADGGFNFRVGLMALFGPGLGLSDPDPTAWGVLPWGYISLGGTF